MKAQIHQFPKTAFDIETPVSNDSIDGPQASSGRPESNGMGGSRPGSQRSNTFAKKERLKKVGIEDILAMRRMEQGGQEDNEEHSETQPSKAVKTRKHRGEVWPTYQFGHDMNELND